MLDPSALRGLGFVLLAMAGVGIVALVLDGGRAFRRRRRMIRKFSSAPVRPGTGEHGGPGPVPRAATAASHPVAGRRRARGGGAAHARTEPRWGGSAGTPGQELQPGAWRAPPRVPGSALGGLARAETTPLGAAVLHRLPPAASQAAAEGHSAPNNNDAPGKSREELRQGRHQMTGA